MNLSTNQIVSISEANQNFSRVARMADKHGELYIFKNNKAKYKLVNLEIIKRTILDIYNIIDLVSF